MKHKLSNLLKKLLYPSAWAAWICAYCLACASECPATAQIGATWPGTGVWIWPNSQIQTPSLSLGHPNRGNALPPPRKTHALAKLSQRRASYPGISSVQLG